MRTTSLTLVAGLGLSVLPVVGGSMPSAPTPVAPDVDKVSVAALEVVSGGTVSGGTTAGDTTAGDTGSADILESDEAAPMVALTWPKGQAPKAGTVVQVRGKTDQGWTDWRDAEVAGDTDPTAEAARADSALRVGTDPVWLGEVSAVQLKSRVQDRTGVRKGRLELIDGGTSAADVPASLPPGSASAVAAKPWIISRAGWGADESLKPCAVSFGETTSGMVLHHTAGTNSYTASQSAGIVRGIYAYHTKSLGWCDIGYNVLVDKYGQIFEGRSGGLDKPVTAAHALGFNYNTWGVSVLGNYETTYASSSAYAAMVKVMAWRSSTFYRYADSTTTLVSRDSGSRYPEGTAVRLPFITGHRDTYQTACPGAKIYANLPTIRKQVGAAGGYGTSTVYKSWIARGGASAMGPVRVGERPTPFGVRTIFGKGSSLWSTSAGTFRLGPGFTPFYEARGGERIWGAPRSDEYAVTGGVRANFTRGFSLLWSKDTGTHSTGGAIRTYWDGRGGPNSPLRLPGGEIWRPTSAGWVQHYQGGTVAYTSTYGAKTVDATFNGWYWHWNGPRGSLGYPVREELALTGGSRQDFQGGTFWDGTLTNPHTTRGAIHQTYVSIGGGTSRIGYPTTEITSTSTGASQKFERGAITWDRASGRTTVSYL